MENIYLVLDGIPGESTSKQVPGSIELVSFNHGVSMPLTGNQSDVGRTTGRCVHQDMTVSKRMDKTTPVLNLYCSGGKTIKNAQIRVFGAVDDGSTVEYYNIKLEDLLVSSVSISAGGGDRPFETVTFNYNSIAWTYVQHDHDAGKPGGNVAHTWNLQTNTAA